jgi:sigma-B regulation protein RsbU (phosphoserine phosphatase)
MEIAPMIQSSNDPTSGSPTAARDCNVAAPDGAAITTPGGSTITASEECGCAAPEGTDPTNPHRIQCMEILGGNRRVEEWLAVPGIDAWIYSVPHEGGIRGGDIHYISTCGGANLSRFVVADVAGHGDAVGALAGKLRSLMRKYINRVDQTRFVRTLNQEFGELSEDGSFATALLTTFFIPTEHLITCNAGHPAPMWFRAEAGTWELLTCDSGHAVERAANLPLGVIDPTEYQQFAVKLAVGDLVLIYTDALSEARNSQGKMLGEQGLREMLASLAPGEPETLGSRLLAAIDDYRDHQPADDDVTLMLLRRNGAAWPRHTLGDMVRVIGKMVGVLKV